MPNRSDRHDRAPSDRPTPGTFARVPFRRSGLAAEFSLRMLAEGVSLIETYGRLPHVVHRLAQHWDDPRALQRAFDDLVMDRRGDRRGLPPEVVREVLALMRHAAPRLDACDVTAVWSEAEVVRPRAARRRRPQVAPPAGR